MNAFVTAFERASVLGLMLLVIALGAQWALAAGTPASWRVWVWRLALIQCAISTIPLTPITLPLLPPRVESVSVEMPPPLPVLPKKRPNLQPNIGPILSSPAKAPSALIPAANKTSPVPATSEIEVAPATPKAIRFDYRVLFLGFYLLGISGYLTQLVRNAWRLRCILRDCTVIEDGILQERLNDMTLRLGLSYTPRLLYSESGAPFLTGLWQPFIVLTREWIDLEPSQLNAVFAHELAHQKRRDIAWNALLWLFQTLFWFHPLVWVGRRFLALETESACDELVLQVTSIAPKAYGALLIKPMSLESSPLTAGVADGFFALQTRLKRLHQKRNTPKKMARIAFALTLALSFGALIPVRLVTREAQAQDNVPGEPPLVQAKPTATPKPREPINGSVVDAAGNPVAGATVYAMSPLTTGGTPKATTVSDAQGAFHFPATVNGRMGTSVFVDAGSRGMAESFASTDVDPTVRTIKVRLTPTVPVTVRMVDEKGQPVPNLQVHLLRLGASANSWMSIPKPIIAKMHALTNERGEAHLPALPTGKRANFVLGDQISKKTIYGSGDLRGVRFAPLAEEDFALVTAPRTIKTIRLLSPISISGRVTLPEGQGTGNVLVLARRVNAAEDAGRVAEREFNIAQTRSNSQGLYVLDGLRPGKYWVWIYPEKSLTRTYTGPTTLKTYLAPSNTQNFVLSRGALIQGVILSQSTGQPVKGQTMGLFDSQENYQYAITDARGFFRFRALGGKQHLWVHANGINSPPPGYILPAKSEFDFTVANGQKREFRIEIPGSPVSKPLVGHVTGPDGKPVAKAQVWYRRFVSSRMDSRFHATSTDENGQFSLPLKWSSPPVQIYAEAGDLTTAYTTVASGQEEVNLRLEANRFTSVSGTVRSSDKSPLAGVYVRFFSIEEGVGRPTKKLVTGADGTFRFDHIRVGQGGFVEATKFGFSRGFRMIKRLEAGVENQGDISVRPATAKLAGRILTKEGKPASRYQVWTDGQITIVQTDASGRFLLPQVVDGPLDISVYSPNGELSWRFKAKANQTGLVFRLSDQKNTVRWKAPTEEENRQRKTRMAALIGQTAPELRAVHWGNGNAASLASLHGQVVLLAFGHFDFRPPTEVTDFARSFENRVQVVGIQMNSVPESRVDMNAVVDQATKELGFPLALDTPLPKPVRLSSNLSLTGQTSALYAGAPFVVIGRDGKIIYAGDEFNRAIIFATDAAKRG